MGGRILRPAQTRDSFSLFNIFFLKLPALLGFAARTFTLAFRWFGLLNTETEIRLKLVLSVMVTTATGKRW